MLEVLKLLLFYVPMLVALLFMNLFGYKIPMHRKWVRLKCVLNLLLDAPFASFSIFHESIIKTIKPSSKALKKSTSWEITHAFYLLFFLVKDVVTKLCSYSFISLFCCFCCAKEKLLMQSCCLLS